MFSQNTNIRHFAFKHIEPLANYLLILMAIILLISMTHFQKENNNLSLSKIENYLQPNKNRNLEETPTDIPMDTPKSLEYIEILRYEIEKKTFLNSLLKEILIGNWTSSSNDFTIGQETDGEAVMKFGMTENNYEDLFLLIKCYEKEFIDHWVIMRSYIDINILLKGAKQYNNMDEIFNGTKKSISLIGEFKMKYQEGELLSVVKNPNKTCSSLINLTFPVNAGSATIQIPSKNISETVNLLKIITTEIIIDFESDCGFNFSIEGTIDTSSGMESRKKIREYTILLITVCAISMISSGITNYQLIKREYGLNAITIVTLGQNFLWHSYCCLSHISFALSFPTYTLYFFGVSMMFLFLFCMFDLRLIFSFLKILSRRLEANNFLKYRIRFYLVFYFLFLMQFFFLSKFFYNKLCIAIMVLLIWIPQMIYNIIKENKISLPLIYIITSSLDRIILPFYFRGNNRNFFSIKKDVYLMAFIIGYICFCILFMYTQTIFGGRFFLPKSARNTFDFYKTQEELKVIRENINQEECVICLQFIIDETPIENILVNTTISSKNETNESKGIITSDITTQINIENSEISQTTSQNLFASDLQMLQFAKIKDLSNASQKKPLQIGKKIKNLLLLLNNVLFHFYKSKPNIYNKKYMLTPCGHLFHTECLEEWLESKQQCPKCRGIIPI